MRDLRSPLVDVEGEIAASIQRTRAAEQIAEEKRRRREARARVVCGCDVRMYNVLVVSFAFMWLFCAYNTLQSYVTSLLPGNLGNVSLTVLYATVVVTVVFTPWLTARIGARASMGAGAFCYVIYLASLIKIERNVVIAASAIVGGGAALLWVALGGFLTDCSRDGERGRNSGIFWGIFQVSGVIGNLAAYMVFDTWSQTTLFIVFTSLGALGLALFPLLRPLPTLDHHNNNNHHNNRAATPVVSTTVVNVEPSASASQGAITPTKPKRHGRNSATVVPVTAADDEFDDAAEFRRLRAAMLERSLSNESASSNSDNASPNSHHHQPNTNGSTGRARAASAAPVAITRATGDHDHDGDLMYGGMGGSHDSHHSHAHDVAASHDDTIVTVGEWLRAVGRMLIHRHMLLLSAMFVWTGLELAFWNGEFPQFLTKDVIGLVLMFVGIAEVIGGLCLGKVSDCLGRTSVVIFGAICYSGGMYLSVLLKRNDPWTQPYLWGASWCAYTAALLFGLADSAFNTCIYSHLGALFADEGVAAFTCLNLLQNLGSAFGFYYSLVWPMHGDDGTYTQIWVQTGVMAVAVIGFILSDRYHRQSLLPHEPS